MKIDEAKEIVQTQLDGLIDNPNVTLDSKYIEAEKMAIKSLEEWEKVKAEIEDMLETLSDGGDDWFTAEKLNDVLAIIDKHLQEVING